jgi:sulfate/thiosulfate transport system ATP-binding protein
MPRTALRAVALAYLGVLLIGPLALVFWRTFESGLGPAWNAVTTPAAVHAFKLTLIITAIAVPANTVFGVVAALAIVRRRFPGKGIVNAVVDLPLALSPVVVGLALFLLYGREGWFGDLPIEVLFALPSMILATIFVSLPFVVREVVPVLREIGIEQEQAAATLGASSWQVFRRITFPSIRWAVAYGVVLTTARSLGEYGDAARRRALPGVRSGGGICLVDRARASGGRGSRRNVVVQAERRRRVISVTSVSKRFGGFTALDDVSLDVESGGLTALLGPSGSGKSTLLRVIAGLEQPDGGEIVISGEDATSLSPQKRGVGFVFQHYAAFKHMTVRDNVGFGLSIRKRPKAEIRSRVDELLELVQLAPFGGRYPAQLSGGQRQRMALARALAVEPKVLLLDEPFGALDARVRAELRDWLRRLHDEVHVTTVFVTHDQEEAMEVADQVAVMNQGRIEQVGQPRELYESPSTEFVMSFVGPVNRIDGAWVRPHDLELLTQPDVGAYEAIAARIVHLGFEVRVELVRGDGVKLWAQVTRDRCSELELQVGQRLYIRASRERVFAHAP